LKNRATHRIYIFEDRNGNVMQADRPTNMFYEIDADHPIERHGTAWMKIIRAKGKAFKTLYGTAPGVRNDVVITDLGARMGLMDNRWYVDVMNVDPYKWMPLKVSEPMSVLQRLAMIVAAVTILVVTFFGSPTRNFTPALILSAIIVILCVVADNIKKRRNN
jgi:hypothetical protein